ncbi:hypothetical protein VTK73DRAFT_1812 [Phialemonium thermophilum]|uniref:Fucose-specific lectin n=1 Tax=Phialemonium thermophilum TaxID=223376 RepID=A0ABR3X7T5_9PEZI
MALLSELKASSLALLILLLSAQKVQAGSSLAAWWTTIGPQLLVQNLTTGLIQYSYCNSNNTPIYPYEGDDVLSLPVVIKAKNGTSLAGTGWWDGKTTTASIFYQDTQDRIINVLLQCDWPTGKFKRQGSWVISDGAPSINEKTGLAALLLGSTTGYRVYFHDANMTINELGYTTDTDWGYNGIVSQDPQISTAISAAFTGKNNITVVSPRDSNNIEVSRFNTDQTWHISTFPRPLAGNLTTSETNATHFALNETTAVNFTLPSFGLPRGIGVTIDPAFTRTVWYIGDDRSIHSIASINFVWQKLPDQPLSNWPLADDSNAELAAAGDFGSGDVRLYYLANGGLVTEARYDGVSTSWARAAPLPTFNASAPAPPEPSATQTSDAEHHGSGGLSSGAKAGIGVGVSLGVVALLGVAGVILYLRRRARSEAAKAAEMEDTHTQPVTPYYDYASQPPYGSPPPPGTAVDPAAAAAASAAGGYAYDKKSGPTPVTDVPSQLDSSERQELEGARPMYELADQTYSHELVGDNMRRELP